MYEISRDWLDYQADQIEALLESNKLDAVVTGVQLSPRWVRFYLQLGLGTKISSVENLTSELALVLEAPAVRVSRSAGTLALEVQLSSPEPVHFMALLPRMLILPPVTGVLGLSMEGDPYTLPLMAPEVTHVLVAGATGCGKTELMRTLLVSLALYNKQAHLQLVLIDPKRRGLTPLAGLPHLLAPVASDPQEATDLLDQVLAEMERRDREGLPATPRIVVAVDEVGDLLAVGDKSIEKNLVRLAQRGREAGFHLICSTQRPSSDAVPSSLKANLPTRLVGKVASAQEALTAAGISGTGAETLMGNGDFISVIGGQVHHFQAAFTGPLDLQRIIAKLQKHALPGGRLRIEGLDNRLLLDADETNEARLYLHNPDQE